MSEKVKFVGEKSVIKEDGDSWLLIWPRADERGSHIHTYGLLTPYFKGLKEGKLLGTKCTNPNCPISKGKGEYWVPPRADCPDCHQPMEWGEVKTEGYVYTYTMVRRGGLGLEIETPYYQIDVKLDGVGTIVKGYLVDRDTEIKIGTKVKANFRTGSDATNTCLDIFWELAE